MTPASDLQLDRTALRKVAQRALQAAEADTNLDDIVESGLRMVYWPPSIGDQQPHVWSYLLRMRELNVVGDTEFLDLEADFAGIVGNIIIRVSNSNRKIAVVPWEQLMASHSGAGDPAGTTKYAALRIKTAPEGSGETWQLWLHPKTNLALILNYMMKFSPPKLTDEFPYPLGGTVHSETFKAAVAAAAEIHEHDTRGPRHELFMERLAASITYDKQFVTPTVESLWPITGESDTVEQLYQDVAMQVGRVLDHGYDPAGWSDFQNKEIRSVVKGGCNTFIAANPAWSFLITTKTISLVEMEESVPLPAEFGGMVGGFSYDTDLEHRNIPIVNMQKILSLRSVKNETGPPQFAAVLAEPGDGTARMTWKAEFYPTPNTNDLLVFTMKVVPEALSETAKYPLGSALYPETIKAACLAAAELHKTGQRGARQEHYQELLARSIEQDAALNPDTAESSWPVAGESGTLDQLYTDIAMRVGKELGHGFDPGAWDALQVKEIKALIQSGYRQALSAHEWKFTEPLQELEINGTTHIYALPDDFGGILNEFTYKPAAA